MKTTFRHFVGRPWLAGMAMIDGRPAGRAGRTAALAGFFLFGATSVGLAGDVAYVEALTGEAAQSVGGHDADLDILDVLGEGAELKVTSGELRLCHYGLHQFLMVKGPFEGLLTRTGITAQKGEAVAASGQKCTEPVISTIQGGVAFRNLGQPQRVALRPAIKLTNTGKLEIRSAILSDNARHQEVATFDTNIAHPQLEDGHTYQLVLEFADGSQRTILLRASAGSSDAVVIVAVR
jgi:hypothetical protein